MTGVIKIEEIEGKIITIQGEKVLLDRDVAEIYGVETKRINEAVKNNLDKFPSNYLVELTKVDKDELVENFDRFNRLKHSTSKPKAFTEKGLYMLATVLKSKQATQTTFIIIETFAKIRNLTRNLKVLSTIEDEAKQKKLMQKSGEIIAEVLADDLEVTDTETTVELNVAFLKFKHTIKKKRDENAEK